MSVALQNINILCSLVIESLLQVKERMKEMDTGLPSSVW